MFPGPLLAVCSAVAVLLACAPSWSSDSPGENPDNGTRLDQDGAMAACREASGPFLRARHREPDSVYYQSTGLNDASEPVAIPDIDANSAWTVALPMTFTDREGRPREFSLLCTFRRDGGLRMDLLSSEPWPVPDR